MGRLTSSAALVASYLIGAFPTAELVTRAVGRDVHREGSGNPGASNTYRLAGAPAAAVVAVVDSGKGAVATWAGARLGAADGIESLGPACGVAAIVGHCFPPTTPGAGGKGVATAAGMLLVVDPRLALAAAVLWAGVAKFSRRASLASIVTAAALPALGWARRRSRPERRALVTAAAIVLLRHRDNMARLRRGEERALAPRPLSEG